jgi:hypothetical protein
MNKIILATTIIMLSACSSLTKWIPSDFDNVEFDRLAELHVLASEPLDGKNWCGSMDIGMMNYHAKILKVYSEHRLNQNIEKIYDAIFDLTTELRDRENPSEPYCKIKRTGIANITEQALVTFGDRK